MPGLVADAPAAKARKPTKNEQRRAKKKQAKQNVSLFIHAKRAVRDIFTKILTYSQAPEAPAKQSPAPVEAPSQPEPAAQEPTSDAALTAELDLSPDDPLYEQFASVIARFAEGEGEEGKEPEKPEVFYDDDENIQGEDEEEETQKRLSKKARKAASKLSIAELKAIVRKPEHVDWTDTSAQDPKLLVNIKSARNVVPVPTHWSLKREYLSSKRGVEKPGFALPAFIAETGIGEMRDAVLEKQAEATLKQQQRARMQGKTGKLDIDYQKLYEAFFRRQTKPTLTRYGEVYYEGKEYETNLRHLRPGELSEELKEALNMPPGAPPPWLINQQKCGPPPSYPALKIQGLNAAPPPGAQWGFHPGGYGKPPVDDQNRPLWGGDVFGLGETEPEKDDGRGEVVDKTLWGELQPFEEEEEEEEEEDEDEEEEEDGEGKEEDVGTGLQTPFGGTETPGGFQSTVPTDFGTHSTGEEFNLRRQRPGTETEDAHPRAAGQVLQERSIRAEGFFGGERAYDLSGRSAPPANVPMLGSNQDDRGRKRKAGDLDVSVDVDALQREDKLSKDEIRKQYEAQRQQEASGGWQGGSGVVDQEDLSNMVAEEYAKRQKLEKQREQRGGKGRR